jgi:exosortase
MIAKVMQFLRSVPPARAVLLAALGALGLWVYWPTLVAVSQKWGHDPQYSHGYLVPAFAVVLLYLRRGLMPKAWPAPCWWGVGLVLVGVLMRLAGAYVYLDWLDAASLVPCLAGLFLLFGGWKALHWSWPAIAFLLFMIPLPYRLETAVSHPLQRIATKGSTYILQTVGFPALAQGNTILLSHGPINVVEACSGLGMMLTLFALATAVAIVVNRRWLDKAIILLSAAPVAVVVNVMRITATGAAQELISPEVAHTIFHDAAGWVMMPVALALLWFELWLLGRLLVLPPSRDMAAAPRPGAPAVAAAPAPAAASANGKQRKRRVMPAPPGTRRR